ncbi:MAG: VanZ family protein [Lachnospiraceae bacterium]|nr:VanZ family protein [Lachnospiraceae bacterium]
MGSSAEKMHCKSNKGKKVAVTVVSAILLSLLYVMIFSFSEQDGDTSSSLSLTISRKCAEILEALQREHWTESYRESLALYFEHPIRKLAHFCEYACMGVLIFGIWAPHRPLRPFPKKWFRIELLWVFLSAALDELHQTFVPGRWGHPADVLLDTAGGVTGFFFIYLIVLGFTRKKKEKTKKEKKNRFKKK